MALITFNILPLSGRIAWVTLSRPCLAEPPAESPSTMKSSELLGAFSWQSANLPGSDDVSNTFFLLVSSLAFLAASLALAASIIFDTNFFASPGVCSSQALNCSEIIFSTTGLTSDETNLSFVCDENLGSGTLTDNTHAVSYTHLTLPTKRIV